MTRIFVEILELKDLRFEEPRVHVKNFGNLMKLGIIFSYTRKNLTSCKKFVNKLSSHCLSQVVIKFGTSCYQFVTTLLILSGLLQGCSNKSDTVMI